MDADWDSSVHRADEELRELAHSVDVNERRMVAGMYDLSADLIEEMADDDDEDVVSALLQQRATTEQSIAKIVHRFPRLAELAKHHDNAPADLIGQRWLAYTDPPQLERFLTAQNATAEQAERMRLAASESARTNDKTRTTQQAWDVITAATGSSPHATPVTRPRSIR